MIRIVDEGDAGVLLAVKVVPGAKRDAVAGRLGDRLKVRVAAPPEGGRANRAVCDLIARELGVRASAVEVVSGHASAEKTVLVRGVRAEDIRAKWCADGA
ncbi:MAG: DUF167 domain-containing protein [Phycisphaerales bacterium]|nr:DUF167 domain-containing protein [Phycisphaerales bacterium]